jgi:hypothetical protein
LCIQPHPKQKAPSKPKYNIFVRNILVEGKQNSATTQSMYLSCLTNKIVLNSYEFLAALLVAENCILFAHLKKQWENIQVGFHETQVCFILTKKHTTWEPYTSSGKQTITLTYDIPQGFKIPEKFEDGDWKGVTLQQAEFEEKQTPFQMS